MNTAIIKPQWSPLTIILMVLGFVVWVPLGFAVLAYILWGELFGGSTDKVSRFVDRSRGFARECGRKGQGFKRQGFGGTSGNAAFDDYRAEQLRRLEEERTRLDEEVNAFHEYMRNLHMARDREEFDRFMRDRDHNRDHNRPQHGENPHGN